MHFFRSREAAESWVIGREGVAILSVAEGSELALVHWIERTRRALAAVR